MPGASHIIKKILLLLVLIVLLMPVIISQFGGVVEVPLRGAIIKIEDPAITSQSWFNGDYQQKKEAALNEHFAFRNFCVRLYDQILYSLFHRAKAENIIVGKNNFLYQDSYIDAYMGKDCIGYDSAQKTLSRLRFISDQLAAEGKQLVIVLAPGKASFYPEFIPDKYTVVGNCTNYKLFAEGAARMGLHLLDANAWFMREKGRSKYPLYPQYGIHWSQYGSVLVADSLIKTIEQLRGIDMPDVRYDSLTMAPSKDIDYDLADCLNLLTRLKSFDMAYVKIKPEPAKGKTRPNVLVISDSFYWNMYDFGINRCFGEHHYWYYNTNVFPKEPGKPVFVNRLSLRQQIRKHDVIVLMATESNLSYFGWGFIESADKLYQGRKLPHTSSYFIRLKDLCGYIKTDPTWMETAEKKAKENGVSLDAQLLKEAEWALENEGIY